MVRLNKDFSYEITIPAGESHYFDFESDSATDKHAPFKNYTIQNISGTPTPCKVFENSQSGFKYIQKGVIFERRDRSISYMKIENTSGTNACDIIITFDNDFSQEELLRALVLGKEELNK